MTNPKRTISDNVELRRNRILHHIRRNGQAGRLEIARALTMSNSRVCDLVQHMLDEGLLLEEATGTDRRGRRIVPVRINPAYGHLVGFDMEATRLRLLVANYAGEIVWKTKGPISAHKNRQELVDGLLAFIESGLATIRGQFSNIKAIGLAAAGIIDVRQGIIRHYDLLKFARDIPLRDLVANQSGLPCIMEDNIRAMTLAESIEGAARHHHSTLCISVRSGIGFGIILNDKLFTGSHGNAGEAAAMVLPVGTSQSHWKVLHDLVSEGALHADETKENWGISTAKANRAGALLGVQLASLAAFIDPEVILLAGGMIEPSGPLYDPLVRTFKKYVLPDIAERIPLLSAMLGPFSAAMGATHRCFELLHPVQAVSDF